MNDVQILWLSVIVAALLVTIPVRRTGRASRSVKYVIQLVVLLIGQVSALAVTNALVELRSGSALWALNVDSSNLDVWFTAICALCGATASFATVVFLNRLLAHRGRVDVRRSLTTLAFVIFCTLLGGITFGIGAPISRSSDIPKGVVSIATSGAVDTRVDVTLGNPEGVLSVASLSGGLLLRLTVKAPPGTAVDVAVGYFGVEKPDMELSKDHGGGWNVGPFEESASPATCGMVLPDRPYKGGYLATTTIETDEGGVATAWMDISGPFDWISTIGDQNMIEPPVLNGAWPSPAIACANSSSYRSPDHQVIDARLNSDYSVSFRDEISPAQPFTTVNSRPDLLHWVSETTSSQVGQSFPQINPAYSISTPDTQRWGSGALFLSALLAGGALTGAFELLRDWPRRIENDASSAPRHRKDD